MSVASDELKDTTEDQCSEAGLYAYMTLRGSSWGECRAPIIHRIAFAPSKAAFIATTLQSMAQDHLDELGEYIVGWNAWQSHWDESFHASFDSSVSMLKISSEEGGMYKEFSMEVLCKELHSNDEDWPDEGLGTFNRPSVMRMRLESYGGLVI